MLRIPVLQALKQEWDNYQSAIRNLDENENEQQPFQTDVLDAFADDDQHLRLDAVPTTSGSNIRVSNQLTAVSIRQPAGATGEGRPEAEGKPISQMNVHTFPSASAPEAVDMIVMNDNSSSDGQQNYHMHRETSGIHVESMSRRPVTVTMTRIPGGSASANLQGPTSNADAEANAADPRAKIRVSSDLDAAPISGAPQDKNGPAERAVIVSSAARVDEHPVAEPRLVAKELPASASDDQHPVVSHLPSVSPTSSMLETSVVRSTVPESPVIRVDHEASVLEEEKENAAVSGQSLVTRTPSQIRTAKLPVASPGVAINVKNGLTAYLEEKKRKIEELSSKTRMQPALTTSTPRSRNSSTSGSPRTPKSSQAGNAAASFMTPSSAPSASDSSRTRILVPTPTPPRGPVVDQIAQSVGLSPGLSISPMKMPVPEPAIADDSIAVRLSPRSSFDLEAMHFEDKATSFSTDNGRDVFGRSLHFEEKTVQVSFESPPPVEDRKRTLKLKRTRDQKDARKVQRQLKDEDRNLQDIEKLCVDFAESLRMKRSHLEQIDRQIEQDREWIRNRVIQKQELSKKEEEIVEDGFATALHVVQEVHQLSRYNPQLQRVAFEDPEMSALSNLDTNFETPTEEGLDDARIRRVLGLDDDFPYESFRSLRVVSAQQRPLTALPSVANSEYRNTIPTIPPPPPRKAFGSSDALKKAVKLIAQRRDMQAEKERTERQRQMQMHLAASTALAREHVVQEIPPSENLPVATVAPQTSEPLCDISVIASSESVRSSLVEVVKSVVPISETDTCPSSKAVARTVGSPPLALTSAAATAVVEEAVVVQRESVATQMSRPSSPEIVDYLIAEKSRVRKTEVPGRHHVFREQDDVGVQVSEPEKKMAAKYMMATQTTHSAPVTMDEVVQWEEKDWLGSAPAGHASPTVPHPTYLRKPALQKDEFSAENDVEDAHEDGNALRAGYTPSAVELEALTTKPSTKPFELDRVAYDLFSELRQHLLEFALDCVFNNRQKATFAEEDDPRRSQDVPVSTTLSPQAVLHADVLRRAIELGLVETDDFDGMLVQLATDCICEHLMHSKDDAAVLVPAHSEWGSTAGQSILDFWIDSNVFSILVAFAASQVDKELQESLLPTAAEKASPSILAVEPASVAVDDNTSVAAPLPSRNRRTSADVVFTVSDSASLVCSQRNPSPVPPQIDVKVIGFDDSQRSEIPSDTPQSRLFSSTSPRRRKPSHVSPLQIAVAPAHDDGAAAVSAIAAVQEATVLAIQRLADSIISKLDEREQMVTRMHPVISLPAVDEVFQNVPETMRVDQDVQTSQMVDPALLPAGKPAWSSVEEVDDGFDIDEAKLLALIEKQRKMYEAENMAKKVQETAVSVEESGELRFSEGELSARAAVAPKDAVWMLANAGGISTASSLDDAGRMSVGEVGFSEGHLGARDSADSAISRVKSEGETHDGIGEFEIGNESPSSYSSHPRRFLNDSVEEGEVVGDLLEDDPELRPFSG
eukprot:ANDGO_04401.mRNA.1 hypothetical protein